MTMTRREFVRLAAGAATATALPRFPDGSGAVDSVGVQLYTVRDAMARDFEGTLRRVSAIGFREVEFAGYFGRTAAQVTSALRAAGLSAPSVHVPVEAIESSWEQTIETSAAIGHRYLVVPWLPPAMRTTLDDWRRTAELFNRAGEQARTAGLVFAYHNHDFEFRDVDGRLPFELLCEETDPALVFLELDVYWITHGGGDAVGTFRRWPGRFPMVHVKDRTSDGRMVDVGAGSIDWPAVFAGHERAGIRHYFIEHDEPADPMASITAGYGYMRSLAL